MKIFRWKSLPGHDIDRFGSKGFLLSRLLRRVEEVTISVARLAPGGMIGHHQAVGDQMLLVVGGTGLVRGEEDRVTPIASGQGVLWQDGERHETRTDEGLTVIVLEGPKLRLEQIDLF